MPRIDPGFADEIKKYGAKDFDACYNCGNCTAVCELTDKSANFPRMFIRYGMLGLKEKILQSKELWLCYACGECTETCPRQAAPGDYMAALRRFAIAGYEPTGITKLIFKSRPVFIVFTILLSVILAFFMFTLKPDHEVSRWLFSILPYPVIHNMGLVVFGIAGISIAWGLTAMYLKLHKAAEKNETGSNIVRSMKQVFNEFATMKRFRKCDNEEDSFWKNKSALVKPWFVHWSVMWGFIGLLVATILDFMIKDPSTDMWLPSRILGTLTGLLLIYGTTLSVTYRLKKVTKTYSETRLSDWTFLLFLWIAGITGFWLEISVALNAKIFMSHIILLIHTIVSMELVLLFAFSKFAHAVYRPLALFFYFNNIPKN